MFPYNSDASVDSDFSPAEVTNIPRTSESSTSKHQIHKPQIPTLKNSQPQTSTCKQTNQKSHAEQTTPKKYSISRNRVNRTRNLSTKTVYNQTRKNFYNSKNDFIPFGSKTCTNPRTKLKKSDISSPTPYKDTLLQNLEPGDSIKRRILHESNYELPKKRKEKLGGGPVKVEELRK